MCRIKCKKKFETAAKVTYFIDIIPIYARLQPKEAFMIIIKTKSKIQQTLTEFRANGKTIGFIPTMGALHEGHISLIQTSKADNDITVCSIYVNPTQFNNAVDLQKYPVTIERDIDLLEAADCNILFLPSTGEMYNDGEINKQYELGMLEKVLEGKYRPGHFQGVCIIVDKLLEAVQPSSIYLGKKDYQQCMVISKMIVDRIYSVKVELCDTIREADGLAMSSRNTRLNAEERLTALKIFESLKLIQEKIKPGNLDNIKLSATKFLTDNGYKVDYTEIADAQTLELVNEWDGKKKMVALVAAYLNDVRLIDNLILQ